MQSAAVVDDELGFELCYLDEAGSGHREPPASWAGLRPEVFHPVRYFRWARGQGHLPCLWWSATTGAHVGHESWLERDLNRTLRRVILRLLLTLAANAECRLKILDPSGARACRESRHGLRAGSCGREVGRRGAEGSAACAGPPGAVAEVGHAEVGHAVTAGDLFHGLQFLVG